MILRLLLTVSLALSLIACGTVPLTGRSQLQLISAQEEMRMGLAAYQEVLKKEKVSQDPALNELVTRVGQRIADVTGRHDYRWEFKVLEDDEQINAFCLPGGKVAVYTGMKKVVKTEDELAAVIGHEVAHAIARHGGERVSQQLLVEGLTVAAVLSAKNEKKAERYAGLIGAGAAVGFLLPYSRLQESEADRMGLIYMARAGYDPRAAITLWRRMAEVSRGRGKPPEFLSTHPADETRIRQLEEWLPEALREYRPR